MMLRPLTLQEANTLLPFVKERFARMQRIIAEGQNLSEALQAFEKRKTAPATGPAAAGAGAGGAGVAGGAGGAGAAGGEMRTLADLIAATADENARKATASIQREIERKKKRLKTIEAQIRMEILQLQTCGVHIKSVFPARADFLGERHRQPVFLCWCMGERNIEHWHPLDESFSTRQPITDPAVFGPVVIH